MSKRTFSQVDSSSSSSSSSSVPTKPITKEYTFMIQYGTTYIEIGKNSGKYYFISKIGETAIMVENLDDTPTQRFFTLELGIGHKHRLHNLEKDTKHCCNICTEQNYACVSMGNCETCDVDACSKCKPILKQVLILLIMKSIIYVNKSGEIEYNFVDNDGNATGSDSDKKPEKAVKTETIQSKVVIQPKQVRPKEVKPKRVQSKEIKPKRVQSKEVKPKKIQQLEQQVKHLKQQTQELEQQAQELEQKAKRVKIYNELVLPRDAITPPVIPSSEAITPPVMPSSESVEPSFSPEFKPINIDDKMLIIDDGKDAYRDYHTRKLPWFMIFCIKFPDDMRTPRFSKIDPQLKNPNAMMNINPNE